MISENIIDNQTKEKIKELQNKTQNIFIYNYINNKLNDTRINKIPFALNIQKNKKYCYVLININSQKFLTNKSLNHKIITINNIFHFYNDIFYYNKKTLQKHFPKVLKMLI